MSVVYDTVPVNGCRLNKSANQSITSGAWNTLTWDVEVFDVGGMHDNSVNNSRITIQKAGRYIIVGGFNFDVNATGTRFIRITKNVTPVESAMMNIPSFATYALRLNIVTIEECIVGDYFELLAFQDSGGNLNIFGGAGFENTFFAATFIP